MTLLIIADDLSGAADCAIAFAGAGLDTVVTLDAAHDTGDASVIAVDTDTRRLPGADAGKRTLTAYQALIKPGRRLYKKIDSTLRGNWAAEVAALQPHAGLAIIAPAFPATGRTTLYGQIWVNGQPLDSTDTWQLEHAGRSADIASMLDEAGLHSARLPMAALRGDRAALAGHLAEIGRSGAHALIVDAETTEDLQTLAEVTAALSEPMFWVGSGGLAREMARLPGLAQTAAARRVAKPEKFAPTLVLVGSLSSVSERQCAMLKERAAISELVVPPAVLREGMAHPDWAGWGIRIGQCLRRGEDLLLRIGRDEAFDPAEGARLSTLLAALVRPHFAHVGGLIATGGETARAMLAAVGIGSLQLQCEIEAGVAFGRPVSSQEGHRPGVVTKAGAFGTDRALYAAWLHMNNVVESAQSVADTVSNPAIQGNQS
ncbi:four-carbon acid sugar kinase family protein [Pseudomonas sp. GD03842]|uniref:four-carbon acid sugar kinase family protein n=1 Tax=Pseudomonas sp. GD03842 TaxID=2975385 RepID=UPI00244B4DFA|nr:four-carbon acid sugar kinase family protein [Pseudomonas sp. GD03842]MDH0747412.1 four-carbon acid sugar kinase family protein [Pseudomonas sp. GD03842]